MDFVAAVCRTIKDFKTMSEVNHNATSFDYESMLSDPNERATEQNEVTETVSGSVVKQHLLGSDSSQQTNNMATNAVTANCEPLSSKMDWKKVAHRLREHNRKLYKNIFRLEQELAELDNKFNKYVEKSQNSDLLLAQQAEEIKQYQENIALLGQQLTSSQKQIKERDSSIERASQQQTLLQNKTTQLEREYASLQEERDRQTMNLAAKERENQELQIQLNQQQQNILQQEAELQRYRTAEADRKKTSSRQHNYPHNKYIQPWTASAIAEPKIALPKSKLAKTQAAATKTAASIATKSAVASNRIESKISSKVTNPAKTKKPQSLAAVELPSFPKPQ